MKKCVISVLTAIIVLFSIPMPVRGAEITTPTDIPLSEIGNRIDALVETYMPGLAPGLAVAVVHEGEIIFSKGYGYADIARGLRVDPVVTAFSHASIGKLFVYVSVMQLVEQGLLDLDNNIAMYLPADLVQQFNFRYRFTMRDLLNHSAGFAAVSIYGNQDAENIQTRKTVREALIRLQPNQIYQPGTAKGYSNFGVGLAAYIVSHISGMDFADYVQAHIFDPLEMTATLNQTHWENDPTFANTRARGYRPDGNGGFIRVPWLYGYLYPLGASVGTVEDLARFAIALTPPQGEPSPLFHRRNTLDLMLSPSYDIQGSPAFRGMHHGFASYVAAYPALGHGGSMPDVTSEFVIIPCRRFAVVVLANTSGGGAGTATILVDKILDLTIGYGIEPAPPIVPDLPNAERVAGSFLYMRLADGDIMEMGNIMRRYWRVEALDPNTITVSRAIPMGMGPDITITYQQIAPYLFRAINATPDARFIARIMSELYFIMENGSPIQIVSNWGFDAKPQTFGQGMTAFGAGMAVSVINMVFFLVVSIIALVGFLRSKGKGIVPFTHLSNGLLVCGLLFGINYWVFEARYMIFMPLRSFMSLDFFTPHIWINWALLIATAVVLAASLAVWKKNAVTMKRRVLYLSSVAVLAAFLFVIWQWNFFVMM